MQGRFVMSFYLVHCCHFNVKFGYLNVIFFVNENGHLSNKPWKFKQIVVLLYIIIIS